jgi:hypothetical protein
MDRTCSIYGRGARTEFYWETLKETDTSEDNIKMDLREIGWEYGLDSSGPR